METHTTKTQMVTYAFTFVAFVFTIMAAILGALNGTRRGGIFENSVGEVSRKYSVELIPSSYVFGTIWPINFIWTIIGSIYLMISVCLPTDKSPVKLGLAPLSYFIFNTLSFAATCSWYFAFDGQTLGWTFAILVFAVASVYAAIGISLKRVEDNAEEIGKNSKAVPWLMRILVQNGLCTFATWITCATMLSLAIILVYVDSPAQAIAMQTGIISDPNASSIGAAILLVFALVYFVLQNFVLEKYLRYIFTVYPVLIFAFSGVIYELQSRDSRQNLIFASVNISICSLLFLISIGLFAFRASRRCAVLPKNEKEELAHELA